MEKVTPEFIVKTLCHKGFPTYIVGGAVRDLFMGHDPEDEDIVTKATPDQIIDIFKHQNIRTVGKSFKVILVDDIEVATFRTDCYNGLSNKNVEIQIAETINEDLARRDLTINSIAYCMHTGNIIDPFNGRKDLENKIIRFVGDAEKRIFDDPNRIIRACRFLALIDGKFEEKTKKALISFSHLISEFVAKDRIRKEILKAMKIKNASLFFQALYDIHALQYIFPSLEDCFAYDFHGPYHGESIIKHSFLTGDYLSTKKPLQKLTGYLHDVGKPISCHWNKDTNDVKFGGHDKTGSKCLKCELENLKFSNDEVKYISGLVRLHLRTFESTKSTRRTLKKLYDYGIHWKDLYQHKIADVESNLKKGKWPRKRLKEDTLRIISEINKKAPNKFEDLEINGFDIMNVTGISPGKDIGIIKKYLLELVLDNPELNSKETLIKILEEELPSMISTCLKVFEYY